MSQISKEKKSEMSKELADGNMRTISAESQMKAGGRLLEKSLLVLGPI